MFLLNGVFSWFKNLSEITQTALVAGGLFTAGLSAGLAVQSWKGIPEKLDTTVLQVDTLKTVQLEQQEKIDSVLLPTLMKIDTSLSDIKRNVSALDYKVEIVRCYQEPLSEVPLRECVEQAGQGLTVPPRNNGGG